jgi:hypothetical protein
MPEPTDCNPHGIERPTIRCRMDETGVSTCNEYEVRQTAKAKNTAHGLSNAGLDQWTDNHLKALTDTKAPR